MQEVNASHYVGCGEYPMSGVVYTDGEDADYCTNLTPIDIDECLIDGKDTLLASMIEGGDRPCACDLVRGRRKPTSLRMSIANMSTARLSSKTK